MKLFKLELTPPVRALSAFALMLALPLAARAATYTSQDYAAKDALVAQWDGIENAGIGVHDATVKAWTDLTGNGHNLMFNSSYASSWTDNALQLPSGTYKIALNFTDSVAVGLSDYMAYEVVYEEDAPRRNTSSFLFGFGKFKGLAIGGSSLCVGDNVPYWAADTTMGVVHRLYNEYTAMNAMTSAAAVYDGVSLEKATSKTTWTQTTAGIGYHNNANWSYRGRIHALRLYNRALTPEEVAQNQTIDRARFDPPRVYSVGDPGEFGSPSPGSYSQFANTELGTPTEIALLGETSFADGVTGFLGTNDFVRAQFDCAELASPGGEPETVRSTSFTRLLENHTTVTWRFKNVQHRIRAVAYGQGGKIAVNGGEDFAAEQVLWLTPGESFTLTAKPEPGYKFLGWHGDVAAEDVAKTELTVEGIPVGKTLTAVFAVSTDNYARDGLVFMLDGLENTPGGHNPHATVWTDLTGNGFDFNLTENAGRWADNGYTYAGNDWAGSCVRPATDLCHKVVTCEFVWKTDADSNSMIFSPGKAGTSNTGMYLYTTAKGEVGVFGSQYSPRHGVAVETGTTNRFAVTYTFKSATAEVANNVSDLFLNGRAVPTVVPETYMNGHTVPTLGGVKSGNSSARGTLMALRIYDRVLTPEEIAHNASVDNERFFGVRDGGFTPFRTIVTSEPGVFGSPSPACGEAEAAYGVEQTFAVTPMDYGEDGVTACPSATNSGIRAVFDYAEVTDGAKAPERVSTTSFSHVITEADTTVNWHFRDVQYRLIVRSSGGGTVKVNGGEWGACVTNWFAPGASVTVSASDDLTLAGWGGDTNAATTAGNAISFAMTTPRMLVAQRPREFVATLDDYFTSGLELWFDGIANDGAGNEHRTDIRYWKDISGHGYVLTNLTANVAWLWAENALSPTAHDKKFKPQVENFSFDWSKATVDWTSYIVPKKGVNTGSFFAHGSTGNNPYAMIENNGHLNARTCSGAAVSIWNNNYVAGAHAMLADGMKITVFQEATGYSSASASFFDGDYGLTDSFHVACSSGDNSQTLAPFHGLRLYSRILNDYELRWNALVDRYRFLGESPDLWNCTVDVMAAPKNVGTPAPGYGFSTNAFGYAQEVSVAGMLATDPFDGARVAVDEANIASGERYVYRGWKLYKGSDLSEGTDETFAFDLEKPLTGVEWQFERQYRVLASANEGNGIEIADGPSGASVTNWYAEGTVVTVRAVPGDGAMFLSWSGDTAGIPDVSAAEISVPMDRARTLQAIFLSDDHKPITITWSGFKSGSWYDPACWDAGAVPQKGDTVVINPSIATEVTIDMSTPVLGKVILGNTGSKLTTTLKMLNWQTCLKADEIEIGNGAVVTTQGGFTMETMSNRVWLAGTKLTIAEGGKIDVKKCGYSGRSPCWVNVGHTEHYKQAAIHGGGFVGGWGNDGYPEPYGSAEWPTDPGSRSTGGGAVRLDFTGLVTVNGDVDADGAVFNSSYGTCGSGGSVLIVCDAITGTGRVLARELDSATSTQSLSGSGGGGRIAVHYNSSSQAAVTDCLVRFDSGSSICWTTYISRTQGYWGGYATYDEDYTTVMPPGSLWFPDSQLLRAASYRTAGWRFGGQWCGPEPIGELVFDEPLLLDQCNLYLNDTLSSFTAEKGVTLTGTGMYARRDSGLFLSNTVVTVEGDLNASGSRFEVIGGSLTVNGDVNLTDNGYTKNGFRCRFNGGSVAVKAMPTNGTENAYGAVFVVNGDVNVSTNSSVYLACHRTDGAIPYMIARNVTVEAGGRISAEHGGWGTYLGPGRGAQYSPSASYGGKGSPTDKAVETYGSRRRPVDPGSGAQAPGGGAVRLDVARTLVLDGEINADAESRMIDYMTSGGSGGSVFIRVPTLRGGGLISATGALMNSYKAAGGGGRVAIWSNHTDEWTGTISVDGGWKLSGTSQTTVYDLTEMVGEPGTVFWHAYPGGTLILVR